MDKFFFHIVFKNNILRESYNNESNSYSKVVKSNNNVKPGNCLILEEKYCSTGELRYGSKGDVLGILYKIKPNTLLFSPENDDEYHIEKSDENGPVFNIIIIGDDYFDEDTYSNERLWYRINIIDDLISNSDNKIVKKGNPFGYLSFKTESSESQIFLTVEKVSLNDSNEINRTISEEMLNKFIEND